MIYLKLIKEDFGLKARNMWPRSNEGRGTSFTLLGMLDFQRRRVGSKNMEKGPNESDHDLSHVNEFIRIGKLELVLCEPTRPYLFFMSCAGKIALSASYGSTLRADCDFGMPSWHTTARINILPSFYTQK